MLRYSNEAEARTFKLPSVAVCKYKIQYAIVVCSYSNISLSSHVVSDLYFNSKLFKYFVNIKFLISRYGYGRIRFRRFLWDILKTIAIQRIGTYADFIYTLASL